MLAIVDSLVQNLEQRFGIPFQLWNCDEAAGPLLVAETETELMGPPPQALQETCARNEPRVDSTDKDQSWLLLPMQEQNRRCLVAAAPVPAVEARGWLAAAKCYCETRRVQASCESYESTLRFYAVQVTDDFEELVFLRKVSEHLELASASAEAAVLAQAVFPVLKHSIRAEGVAFVAGSPNEAQVGPVVARCGADHVQDETYRRLVSVFLEAAEQQALVRNHLDKTWQARQFAGVFNFVMLRVAKDGDSFGWLIAVNRTNREPWDGSSSRDRVSTCEFGTSEASILSSAASMFAVQSANAALFCEKEQLLTNMVRTLVSAIEARDSYTCGHSERVARYSKRLGRQLGFDEVKCEQLYLTGLLHDVGKIGIGDSTLLKPGKLTDAELAEIQKHPAMGLAILRDLEQLRYVFPGVVHHHERYDGRGYPDQLAGTAIPEDGRVLAVCDAFDAMTSDRPYRKEIPYEKAIQILRKGAGTQWDPAMVDAFLACLDDMLRMKEERHPSQPPDREENTGYQEPISGLPSTS